MKIIREPLCPKNGRKKKASKNISFSDSKELGFAPDEKVISVFRFFGFFDTFSVPALAFKRKTNSVG